MRIFAIHGGPRKNMNTDLMLQSFVLGVKSNDKDVEIETTQLFDLDYKGVL